MRRGWWVLVLAGLAAVLSGPAPVLSGPAAAAAADRAEPPTRADRIAAALRRDPVYVTDHSPRSLPPDAAARIKASVARLGTPVYVAVTPTVGVGQEHPGESLAALLRDRLGEDGVYIVANPRGGDGEARQFGGGRRLPLDDAWWAANFELPYDAAAPDKIALFVDIALSGRAAERRAHPRPAPKSETRKALDADDAADRRADRVEMAAFGGGAVLSGAPLLGLLAARRVRRSKRRDTKAARAKAVRKKQAVRKKKGRR